MQSNKCKNHQPIFYAKDLKLEGMALNKQRWKILRSELVVLVEEPISLVSNHSVLVFQIRQLVLNTEKILYYT